MNRTARHFLCHNHSLMRTASVSKIQQDLPVTPPFCDCSCPSSLQGLVSCARTLTIPTRHRLLRIGSEQYRPAMELLHEENFFPSAH